MASLSLVAVALAIIAFQAAEAAVPAVFIFGDSTVDVGTNTYIPESLARANFPHNGIDYPNSKPTGRFSNGYNTADMIVRLMGYKRSPPPFLSLISNVEKPSFKRKILRGVNFASGGSGIFDQSGLDLIKVIPLGEQIQQFTTVHGNISQVMGPETITLLSKSIFIIDTGGNDIFEYLVSNQTHNSPDFMAAVMNKYQYHLKNLLDLGARKLGIVSVSPIGCVPLLRVNNTGGCQEEMNTYAQIFYTELEGLLKKLSLEYKGLKYSLGNSYEMYMDFIDNPLVFGFKDSKTACCGNGTFNAEYPCLPDAKVCLDRDDYLFWDRSHATQAAAQLAARTLYSGSPRFVPPMNFRQLVEIDVYKRP